MKVNTPKIDLEDDCQFATFDLPLSSVTTALEAKDGFSNVIDLKAGDIGTEDGENVRSAP
jgi:hypothetical protein